MGCFTKVLALRRLCESSPAVDVTEVLALRRFCGGRSLAPSCFHGGCFTKVLALRRLCECSPALDVTEVLALRRFCDDGSLASADFLETATTLLKLIILKHGTIANFWSSFWRLQKLLKVTALESLSAA